jgi:RNA polymerase sigma-70 factor (ECF subfamily)
MTDAAGRASFVTTRWSVVLAARTLDDESRAALETLCRTYWYPLYASARRRGADRHEAEDLVQSFFAELLAKRWVEDADPSRGRFRAFLLTAFRRHCTKARVKDAAQKRGGGRVAMSLDFDDGESRLAAEPASDVDPDRAFERRWALALLARALERTRREFETGARAELAAALLPHLGGAGDARPYADIAARLGMTEGAVKVAAHRVRARYGEIIRAEIRDTVATDADVEDELRRLMDAVAG